MVDKVGKIFPEFVSSTSLTLALWFQLEGRELEKVEEVVYSG